MKKRKAASKKVTARKVVSRRRVKTSSRSTSSRATVVSFYPVVTVRRFIVVGGLAALFLVLFVFPQRQAVIQSVAGASIARPLFAEGTVSWSPVNGAQTYNVYYRKAGEATFEHAVRQVPNNSTSYTISYLRKGVKYEYRVSAADSKGEEFWWSDIQTIMQIAPM